VDIGTLSATHLIAIVMDFTLGLRLAPHGLVMLTTYGIYLLAFCKQLLTDGLNILISNPSNTISLFSLIFFKLSTILNVYFGYINTLVIF
jgi:hypothetical protein